jgi:hypothetical protein
MRKTPIPLYRQGNATSPRMDNVRVNKDVATLEDSGVIWVLASIGDDVSPGGVSTFANPGAGKNWWKLDAGIDIPERLTLINDRGNHWLWQPTHVITLDNYQDGLRIIGALFNKIN